MMEANIIAISVFELSAAPKGQLISFEPNEILVTRISQLGFKRGSCCPVENNLIITFDELAFSFIGAAPFCDAWAQSGLPTYLCALSPELLSGAIAFSIDWHQK